MSEVRILPEILSNKIAAGEVVERPASVVKELVENALDAGSTKIMVEIEKGGRSLIRVSDNGTGMGRDDALLSLERYATSKISEDRDLFQIKTLGFRGEALPSIAAVSRFHLITREKEEASGTGIVVEGGKIKEVSEAGAPPGTLVEVKQLFFNTPARRKFLKTINTEMGHIADTLSSIALSRPEVQFRLLHNGKPVKSWSVSPELVQRVVDVLGKELGSDLHRLTLESDAVSITGWISSSRITRSTSRGIYIYVNGRFVRDRMIQHGLIEGYHGSLMKGQYPVAVLLVTVPFDRVDVNVHPAKNEVRFVEQQNIHQQVIRSVSETLHRSDRPKWTPSKPAVSQTSGVSEPRFTFRPAEERIPFRKEEPAETMRPVGIKEQETLWEQQFFSDLRLIGQAHSTYIICEAQDALVLIDQHAAHERVLFEQLRRRSATAHAISQTLLLPETVDLGFREAVILEDMIPDLKRFGLEVEPFGGNTFAIKAVPDFLAGRPAKPLVLEMVEQIAAEGGSGSSGVKAAQEQCLILIACHGAIRANQQLTEKQMKALLAQLDECETPSHCPHGRPTWIRWTSGSLEKSFRRIV
ncbi:MAG: DNA mismatch repair endonuclease MutL [Desulfobacterales bacterium]